jgi:hypothetical protein
MLLTLTPRRARVMTRERVRVGCRGGEFIVVQVKAFGQSLQLRNRRAQIVVDLGEVLPQCLHQLTDSVDLTFQHAELQ